MRVLFFTPGFGRTGAETALKNIVCNADRSRIKMGVVYKRCNPFPEEIPSDVPTFVYGDKKVVRVYERARRVVSGRTDSPYISRIHRRFKSDVWYINTVIQPE